MPKHRQVLVDAPFFCDPISVDAGLASTLEMVWKEGYITYNSCEDNFGELWIEFDMNSFHRLVQRAHDSYKDADSYTENLGEFLETSCETRTTWNDDGYPNDEDEWISGETIELYISVRFDRGLLDTFTRLFTLAHASPLQKDNLETLRDDTSYLAHEMTAEHDNIVFWYTENARRTTVYAWTDSNAHRHAPLQDSHANLSSCVMQPGHIGKTVSSIPKDAKPYCPVEVVSNIVQMCGGDRPIFEDFFPNIEEQLIYSMQDCVDATWLCSKTSFSAADIALAERISAKVKYVLS